MLGMNLEYLARYIRFFNGKKVVNVSMGPGLLSLDEFKSLMNEKCIEIEEIVFTVDESSPLGETKPFVENLLPEVESLDSREITFYCHTKGVSHMDFTIPKIWMRLMWEGNLGDIRKVERILETFPCCGVLKKGPGTVGELTAPWHFSGTFFWFRNDRIFNNDWRKIDDHRCGVETYLSRRFDTNDAWCLKYDLKPRHGNTRLLRVWKDILGDPDYDR